MALSQLPWAALPGKKSGTVLLEEVGLAVVPHGPFLLGQLARRGAEADPAAFLLAVGDVSYDRAGRVPGGKSPAVRSAPDTVKGLRWPPLPGTRAELSAVLELAGERPKLELRGPEATAARCLRELPGARWAHFATHGFFADAGFRTALPVDGRIFQRTRIGLERASPGARNPLALSGLVLAGANLPVKDPLSEDGGILTAEGIAGLPLGKLELAVLSACETGLGEAAGGEGAFGLQRAFHLAGCQNVVASLWQVDDEATRALMGLFYHNLWVGKMPPIEALRQAQLTLYRHPERIPALARARGPDFDRVARRPAAASGPRAPARLWAGFVLSGAGR
jgi:CHAT domain-containing protein